MPRRTADRYDAFGEPRSILDGLSAPKADPVPPRRESQEDRLQREVASALADEDADHLGCDIDEVDE